MIMAEVTFRAIRPKMLQDKRMRKALEKGLERFIKKPQKDFEKTTSTWEHGVEFPIEDRSSAGRLAMFTGTDDEVYAMVNDGTEPHIIRPVKAQVLAFPVGYKAKTSPGRISSGSGGASGLMAFAREIHHPGTKARHFDKAIADKWQSKFRSEMNDVMSQVRKESTHEI